MDSVRKGHTPHLGLTNDMQCGKRILLLFDLEMANNKFFLDLNPLGLLTMPTEHVIGHDHVQEVEEGYELLLPLTFYTAEVPNLPPKSEVLPHLPQRVEEAATEHELSQVQ